MQGGPASPFFLPVGAGQRYCLYQPAAIPAAAAVLFVHPFGEELNRSRRMSALQARALQARGIASLRIDLHGCGDSSGDFADARWEQWIGDLASAAAWLQGQGHTRIALLGQRLGSLLALEAAHKLPLAPVHMVLWQLPASGQLALTQWLRLRSANALAGSGAVREGPQELRAQLAGGQHVEVGGYALAPALSAAIDALQPSAPACRTTVIDIVQPPAQSPLPATLRACADWKGAQVSAVQGAPFWATPEISICDALIAATCAALEGL